MKQSKRALSMLLAVLMVLATGIAAVLPVVADDGGNVAKIGETEYETLEEAIDAAESGDTITLLKNLTWTVKEKKINKEIVIDGGTEKYRITSTVGYLFDVYRNITLKNLTMDTKNGFRFKNTVGETSVATIENVEWTIGAGLLVNIQGAQNVAQTLNVINSTITKLSGNGEPLIANYNTKSGIDVTINIESSILTQYGGETKAATIENRSIFYFANKANVTLNLNGNSVLNYGPQSSTDATNALLYVWRANATVNAESTVSLNLLDAGAATKKTYFVYLYSKDGTAEGTVTVTDKGAAWNVSAAIAWRGFYFPVSGSYDVNGTSKAVVEAGAYCHGDSALTYRKAAVDYAENELSETERAYSGYSFKVGTDYYKTWVDALNAEGDIKLIANAPNISEKITLAKNVVIDGQGKYILSSTTYFFELVGYSATFRNLLLNVYQGIGTGTSDKAAAVLFENCKIDVTGGLLLNCKAQATVTFKNTIVASTAGDDMMLFTGAEIQASFENSSFSYNGGSKTTSHENTSVIAIAGGANVTLNIDAKSKVLYNPDNDKDTNQIITVTGTGTVANIRLEAGATLEYNTVPASVTSLAFLRNGEKSTLNLVDEGAIWTVSEAVAKKGYRFVNNAGTFNCKTVAMKAADGKLYSPTATITALTAKTSFAPIGMGVSNEMGASIRLSEPTGIRFGTKIDKDFFVALGSSAVYGVKVARKDVLQNGNFAALTADNSVSYDSASETFRWVTEGAFFRTVLMNIGKDNYATELCWNAYVTITYADGTTATFWADWTEADNCRSLAQVAQSALADTTVTWTEAEAALLNTIAGN